MTMTPPKPRRLRFAFTDASLVTHEQLVARGFSCHELLVCDPVTGDERVLRVPEGQEAYYCTPGRREGVHL